MTHWTRSPASPAAARSIHWPARASDAPPGSRRPARPATAVHARRDGRTRRPGPAGRPPASRSPRAPTGDGAVEGDSGDCGDSAPRPAPAGSLAGSGTWGCAPCQQRPAGACDRCRRLSPLAGRSPCDCEFSEVRLLPGAYVVQHYQAQPPGVKLRQQQTQADLGFDQLDRALPNDLVGPVPDLQDKSTVCSRPFWSQQVD